MGSERHTNAYLANRVLSASPEELRLMLIEGAIRFARIGREGLARRDFEQWYNGMSQCQAILLELMTGLRPEIAPELCGQLNALYTFMYRRLLDASSAKDPVLVDEVVELLEYDRQSWIFLMEKIDAERAGDEARIADVMRRAARHEAQAPRTDANPDMTDAAATEASNPQHHAPPQPPATPVRPRLGAGGTYAPAPGTYAPPIRRSGLNAVSAGRPPAALPASAKMTIGAHPDPSRHHEIESQGFVAEG